MSNLIFATVLQARVDLSAYVVSKIHVKLRSEHYACVSSENGKMCARNLVYSKNVTIIICCYRKCNECRKCMYLYPSCLL